MIFQDLGNIAFRSVFQGNHSLEIFLSEKLIQYEIVSNMSKCENIYKLKYLLYQIYKPKVKIFQSYYIRN